MSTFNDFMNHLMANKGGCCHAPSGRYCEQGKRLKEAYTHEGKKAYDKLRQRRNTGFNRY
ncbi:hypothetical protein MTZ49_01640 [Entomomonas sp. E2T0]|uniref:hypothetical protein n=1 Tax=Entomomonas sp. E2T0 TaxID=2930213 RepID=UPI002228521D|nr:hypothetical protein [Entomomonas sp. E2T0]UYZ84310.1 hypothetical protein MTZ49_01640 [Entomomonas sp. E2T0]